MELPKALTSDIKLLQQQLKLAIQAHQIMRIKHKGDPDNFKLRKELREVEKRIMFLGEKQNRLVQWLRKELMGAFPTNTASIAKSVASALGFASNRISNRTSIMNKNQFASTLKNSITRPLSSSNVNKVPVFKMPLPKAKSCVGHTGLGISPENRRNMKINRRQRKAANVPGLPNPKILLPPPRFPFYLSNTRLQSIYDKKLMNVSTAVDPIFVEKVNFLSAVGLVTREVLSELQNKRVERKRRSTANHTQFIYGNDWDISPKKRKRSNYLTNSKQHVTRQTIKTQNQPSDLQVTVQERKKPVSIFKTPVVCTQSSQLKVAPIVIKAGVVTQRPRTVFNSSTLISTEEPSSGKPQIRIPGLPASLTIECIPPQICIICRKPGDLAMCSGCSDTYHLTCFEKSKVCPHCDKKFVDDVGELKAEKLRLLEVNNHLNAEKKNLEERANELSVTLTSLVPLKFQESLVSSEDS